MKQFSKRIVASGCGAMTSIRSVTEKPSVAVGKTKADRPLAPGASPLRAKSVRTSAIAPFEIQVFSPLMIQRSEEHTSELQSLMRISYAVFCLKKKTNTKTNNHRTDHKENNETTI